VYAFDANPECCLQTSRNLAANRLANAEVIQAALGDQRGSATFYVSTEDQTGLSSLAPIPRHKEAIAVPRIRLQDFFKERRISRVRLMKLDVEGAEELVLRGLARFLADRRIDFILMECFDERLELLNTSTERIAGLLQAAGYQSWEFGTMHPSGWSITTKVHSRGDVCYLFSSPSARGDVPTISVVRASLLARSERDEADNRLQAERQDWRERLHAEAETSREQLQAERQARLEQLAKAEQDIEWLWDGLHKREQAAVHLRQEKAQLEAALNAIEKSPGWRLLNSWRWFRDRLAPEGSWRRRLYESGLNRFRGGR
jgi:FkbM family methyltransferase